MNAIDASGYRCYHYSTFTLPPEQTIKKGGTRFSESHPFSQTVGDCTLTSPTSTTYKMLLYFYVQCSILTKNRLVVN
jgi:hypothetical protein